MILLALPGSRLRKAFSTLFFAIWLDKEADTKELMHLLRPYDGELISWKVSKALVRSSVTSVAGLFARADSGLSKQRAVQTSPNGSIIRANTNDLIPNEITAGNLV